MAGLLRRRAARFVRSSEGSIAIQFAFVMLPLVGAVGIAVDYGRATHMKTGLQEALDAAVLAGARAGDGWSEAATNHFDENVNWGRMTPVQPIFTIDVDENVTGSVAGTMPTSLLKVLGISSVDLNVGAVASIKKRHDNSCLLALGQGNSLSQDSIVFNGAPNVEFEQCTIRSNTSLRCNGHDGGAAASIAAGSVSGCDNAQPDASVVPDIHASLAANITSSCSGSGPAVTWTPGQVPPGITSANRGTHVEYHVCGDLILSGSGYLTGVTPGNDSVIFVENGSLTIDDKSTVSTKRVAIVLTGNNQHSSTINFPNGKGKASILSLSPPTNTGNPWRGISLYQDPILTKDVDHSWGPGASLTVDGIVYLPNSDVTMSGSGSSNVTGCTKFISDNFRTNGAVDISFQQSEEGCASLGVNQWFETETFLSQ